MKETKHELTVELPHVGLEARIVIERIGQVKPERSNEVEVSCQLELPVVDGYIHPMLRFGTRLSVFDWQLVEYWGDRAEKGRRTQMKKFAAKKWKEAFSLAEYYAKHELQKLIDALEERHQALVDAED